MIDYSDLDQNNGVHYFHCTQEHGNIILRMNTYFFYLPVSMQSVRGHSTIVFDGHY